MRGTFDYAAVLERVRNGMFCDINHAYCPVILEDGTIKFPSCGIVKPDGSFGGPDRLAARITHELSQSPSKPKHFRPHF